MKAGAFDAEDICYRNESCVGARQSRNTSKSPAGLVARAGRLAALAAVGSVTALAGAQAFAQATSLPPPVKAAVAEWQSYCKSENKPLKLSTSTIRSLDLSGDGRIDYILDESTARCAEEYPWCGSGGCGVSIFMQTANGYVKVFDDIGGKVSIARRGKGYTVLIRGGARLVFDKGCAIDLAHGRARSCKAAE